jgi:hypothetical protein
VGKAAILRVFQGLVVVLLLSCAAVYWADLRRQAQIESALAEIRKAGGTYARQDGGRTSPVTALDLAAIVQHDSGDMHERGPVKEATLVAVARLDRLQVLSLDGANVTDADLARLVQLRELRSLNLARTSITDAAVPYLKELTGLRWVDLRGTKVTSAGANQLHRALPMARLLTDYSE